MQRNYEVVLTQRLGEERWRGGLEGLGERLRRRWGWKGWGAGEREKEWLSKRAVFLGDRTR